MNNADQPVYPLPSDVDSSKVECIGLTKREHFAGLAMQGLLANPKQIADFTDFEWIAQHAIGYADALLKELSKTK